MARGHIGEKSRHPVVDDHEDEDQDAGDDAGPSPLVDGILAQGGTDGPLLEDVDGCGQGAAPKNDGQVRGLLHGEGARDLGLSAGDPLLDHRSGMDDAVQDNGEAFLDVVCGDPVEVLGPLGV